MNNNNEKTKVLTTIFVISVILVGAFGIALLSPDVSSSNEVKTFSSYDELKNFLSKNIQNNYYFSYGTLDGSGGRQIMTLESDDAAAVPSTAKSNSENTVDYSETNVQVEGVDEPDIVKTDGSYIYLVSGNQVYIVQAYPGETAAILSTISLDKEMYVSNMFINDDSLVIFGTSYREPIYYATDGLVKEPAIIRIDDGNATEPDSGMDEATSNETTNSSDQDDVYTEKEDIDENESTDIESEDMIIEPYPYYWGISSTIVRIYNIGNRASPELVKDVEIDGNYYDARMIGDFIYIISTEYTYELYAQIDEKNATLNIPQITINNETKEIPYNKIHYVDIPERMDTMTHVIALNLENNEIDQESFMLGGSQNMYVSQRNIYLVYTQYDYDTLLADDKPTGLIAPRNYDEHTVIHKISIDSGKITYETQGEVPGHILNQFSMDEHNGFFRIATTVGWSWDESNPSTNNIYILDEDLDQISSVEDIAPGESIYSARFMGDRAYLVTFVKIDPFFTIDLSDPYNPEILGELKIPGYSDYLHPYDENHVIGIGKDAVDPIKEYEWTRNFAWYQGVKIALFDVTDFENPVVTDQVIIGDRGTDSTALHNHKAFLFDKEKELLVIPISLYEIDNSTKNSYIDDPGAEYGTFTFQGAYIYNLNLDGFEYKGRITHMDNTDFQNEKYGYWYWGSTGSITRSLYIDNILYTISDKMIKMNDLDDLSEINSIDLE